MINFNQFCKSNLIAAGIMMTIALVQPAAAQKRGAKAAEAKPQSVRVEITQMGYEPGSIALRRGVQARLIFTRRTDATCAKEIVIPAFGISRALPLNEAVVVTLTPRKTGEFTFTCGMDMMRGKLVVR